MNEATRQKFAAIYAAQLAKKAQPKFQATTAPTPAELPAPTPTPAPAAKAATAAQAGKTSLSAAIAKVNKAMQPQDTATAQQTKLSKLKSFTILWHEGPELNPENKSFKTWNEAHAAMKSIYETHEGQGYTKVKICVQWENGKEITDRADCSDSKGDFCATSETIGEYLQRQTSVMYESNLQQGDRLKMLSFTDDENTATPELSKYTFEELINTPEEEPQTQEPAPATTAKKCDIEIKEYNAASFTVRGKDTYKIKDELRANGGAWNRYLKEGAAWIFSKKKYYTVKTLIEKSF